MELATLWLLLFLLLFLYKQYNFYNINTSIRVFFLSVIFLIFNNFFFFSFFILFIYIYIYYFCLSIKYTIIKHTNIHTTHVRNCVSLVHLQIRRNQIKYQQVHIYKYDVQTWHRTTYLAFRKRVVVRCHIRLYESYIIV